MRPWPSHNGLPYLQVGWEAFGVMHDHNLKDDGANIAVTSANRKE